MNFKKLSSLLLSGLLVFSLAGCGSGSSDSSNSDTEGKEKIVAWAWDKNFNIAALEEAKAIYEKENPDVEIEIVEFAQSDIIQKLNTGLSSGSTDGLPNIVLIEDYRSQTFLKSYPDSFKDLSDITTSDKFAPYKLDFMTLEGKTYGIPFDTGTTGLFYRSDLIQEAGYTDEDMQDLTWEKFIEIGKAVKEKTGVDMLTLDPNDIGQVRMMMQSAGTWYVKEDGQTPNFTDNEALKESVLMYQKLVEANISKTVSEWSQFVAAPNSGEVATVPTGCWFMPSIMGEESQSGLWKIAPLPRLGTVETSVNASNLGGSSWYVLDNVEGSDVAKDFMGKTFGSNSDFYQTILDKNGVIGTYLPAQEGEVYTKESEFFGGQKVFADLSEWSSEIPSVNYGLHTYAFEDILKAEVQNLLQGADIDTCLTNAQTQAESQIR